MLADHPRSDCLSQKVRAFEIGRNKLIKTLFPRVENVSAYPRRDSGVVYENIELAELFFDLK